MKAFVLITAFFLLSCQDRPKFYDAVKEVEEVVEDEKRNFADEDNFFVRGKITGYISFFGKGAYRLADRNKTDKALTILVKNGVTHAEGDSVVIQVSRSEVIRLNGMSWSVYSEL